MLSLFSYRLKRLHRGVLARLSLLAPAMARFLRTPCPLMMLEYAAQRKNRTLLILLPGIDDLAEDFERRDFVRELQRQRVAADAVALDAHFGYYATRAIFERITDDVIASARAAGYREIWLVGISLGGFGAASYAARHPGSVSGVTLLAPYLGGKSLIREIDEAGGLDRWEPGQVDDDDFPRRLWAWLKRNGGPAHSGPQVYLGYGKNDAFARAHALLAATLPPERVFSIAGRHDWRTWRQIWRMFLVQWSRIHG